MWQMLCERAKDLKIEFRDIEADGIAAWLVGLCKESRPLTSG